MGREERFQTKFSCGCGHQEILELTRPCLAALHEKTAVFVCPTCGKGNDHEAICEALIAAQEVQQRAGRDPRP